MPAAGTQFARQFGAVCLAVLLTGPLPVAAGAEDRCAPLASLVAWAENPPSLGAAERENLARQITANALSLGLSESLHARLLRGLQEPGAPVDPLFALDRDRLRHLLHLCRASRWDTSAPSEPARKIGFELPRDGPVLLLLVLMASAGIALLVLRDKQLQRKSRREARVLCRIASRYSCANGQEFPTVISDISRSGCRVSNSGRGLHEGAMLVVMLGGKSRHASVQWCNSHNAGLRFDQPLSPEELSSLVAQSKQLSAASATTPKNPVSPDRTQS